MTLMVCQRTHPLTGRRCHGIATHDVMYQIGTEQLPRAMLVCDEHRSEMGITPLLTIIEDLPCQVKSKSRHTSRTASSRR
jgi:hypothetical protein